MKQTLIQELHLSLTADVPSISPKFFYDDIGSHLFDVITLLEEYYPTRTEQWIMDAHRAAIAEAVGDCDVLLDLGGRQLRQGQQTF